MLSVQNLSCRGFSNAAQHGSEFIQRDYIGIRLKKLLVIFLIFHSHQLLKISVNGRMTVTILIFDYYTFDVLTADVPDIPPAYPSNIPPTSKICVKTALLREPWSDVGFRVLSAANPHYTRFLRG